MDKKQGYATNEMNDGLNDDVLENENEAPETEEGEANDDNLLETPEEATPPPAPVVDPLELTDYVHKSTVRIRSEIYGSKYICDYRIGPRKFKHQGFNVHATELAQIGAEIQMVLGDMDLSKLAIANAGPSKEESENAKIKSLEEVNAYNRERISFLENELKMSQRYTEEEAGEDQIDERPDVLIDAILLVLAKDGMRLKGDALHTILDKLEIAYDKKKPVTVQYKESVLGFLGIEE